MRLYPYVVTALPFCAMLAFGQVRQEAPVDNPVLLWFAHPRVFAVAVSGFAGAFLSVVLGNTAHWLKAPDSASSLARWMAFHFVSALMILPWIFETFLPDASISTIMALSCIGTTLAPQFVPKLRDVASTRMDKVLSITQTNTVTKTDSTTEKE